jgi:hypothetical protein
MYSGFGGIPKITSLIGQTEENLSRNFFQAENGANQGK